MRNSAKDTNQRNCQEDSYQTVRETLAWQKVNRTHEKQCTTPKCNKPSTEHMQAIVRGTNVTNNPTEHAQNGVQNSNVTQIIQNHSKQCASNLRTKQSNRTHTKQCARHYEANRHQNTLKTVPKTLPWQKNQTDHIQNIVQGINVTWNQTEHIKKCSRH